MPDSLGQLGGLFGGGGSGGGGSGGGGSTAGTAVSGGLAGAGAIGNLLTSLLSGGVTSGLNKQLKSIEGMSPAQFSSMVTSAEGPINAGLVQSVGNRVQGDLASRGLSQAPGIFASEEAQALGPIEQQNYQVALEQTLAKLGLPLSYASVIQKMLPGQQSMTPALQALLRSLAAGNANKASASSGGLVLPGGPTSGSIPTTDSPVDGSLIDPSLWTGGTDSGDLDLSALGVGG
jgi:hypothetical protein